MSMEDVGSPITVGVSEVALYESKFVLSTISYSYFLINFPIKDEEKLNINWRGKFNITGGKFDIITIFLNLVSTAE